MKHIISFAIFVIFSLVLSVPLAAGSADNARISNISSDASNVIRGVVYNDANGNLQQDNNESGLSDLNVSLAKIDGLAYSTLTGDSGYEFTGLSAGTYVLYLDVPESYLMTHPLNNTYVIDIGIARGPIERDFGVHENSYRLINGVSFNADIHGFTVEGLTFDSSGNLYHVDMLNKVVNKFDKNGTLLMSLGDDTLAIPGGIAIDSSGNIFVSEKFGEIKKFDSEGNFLEIIDNKGNGTNQYRDPRGLTIDQMDNLYVADGGHRVQKFDREGRYIGTIGEVIPQEDMSGLPDFAKSDPALPFSYLHLPFDVKLDSKGNIFVADTVNNRVQKFDSDGKFLLNIGRSSDERIGPFEGQFNRPRAIAIGPDDSVYVADTYYNRIQVFDNDGRFITAFGSLGSEQGQFSSPSGITVDKDTGNIYVADSGNGRIQVFDDTGKFLSEFRTRTLVMEPYFSFIHDGYVLVSDNAQHKVHKFDLNDGTHLDEYGGVGGEPGQFRGPRGIAIDSAGDMWVADNYNNRIQKLDSEGNPLLTVGKLGKNPGEFRQPRGLVVDAEDNVLVADTQNNRIQKFTSNGTFVASFTTPKMLQPYQISLDKDGNIYVAEAGSKSIEKLDSSGKSLLVFGGEGTDPGKFQEPRGVSVDSQGNIYTTDQSNRIQKFDPAGKLLKEFGQWGPDPGEFFNPRGIFVDESGNVWVNDTQNERIQVFDQNGTFVKEITYAP